MFRIPEQENQDPRSQKKCQEHPDHRLPAYHRITDFVLQDGAKFFYQRLFFFFWEKHSPQHREMVARHLHYPNGLQSPNRSTSFPPPPPSSTSPSLQHP